jgi:magnesium chelatase subunit I
MQEGDVQIKGYPVRLELDVALVFSANPEDYTARGKIVTPLKDRMGSEIRTHYPQSVPEGIAITRQECWSDRGCLTTEVPDYIYEIVEQIAFVAREDKKVDKRSGVSQRLPISTMELAVSNAERRALLHGESLAFPRVGDIYTALPGITGKIELEYEGEMKGADVVVREIIRTAVLRVYDQYFADTNTQQIEQWFNLGGSVKIEDSQSAKATIAELEQIQGLFEKLSPLAVTQKDAPEKIVAAAEFLLEGLYAHKKLSRSEERGFTAQERARANAERNQEHRDEAREYEQWQQRRSNKQRSGLN